MKPPETIFQREDGKLIWGEYSWVTDHEFFDEDESYPPYVVIEYRSKGWEEVRRFRVGNQPHLWDDQDNCSECGMLADDWDGWEPCPEYKVKA